MIIKLTKRDGILKYDRLYLVNYFLIYLNLPEKKNVYLMKFVKLAYYYLTTNPNFNTSNMVE